MEYRDLRCHSYQSQRNVDAQSCVFWSLLTFLVTAGEERAVGSHVLEVPTQQLLEYQFKTLFQQDIAIYIIFTIHDIGEMGSSLQRKMFLTRLN